MLRLTLMDFKRNKKSWLLLCGVMTLTYAFLAMMLIFFSSMDRTEEVEREKSYGSWHVALIDADDEGIEAVKNHATVEKTGYSEVYGMVLDDNGAEVGKIGTVDKNTIEMENIQLLSGRMPDKDGEIALEMSAATKLEYKNGVGEEKSVEIRVATNGNSKTINKKYTVVGILEDYSSKMKGTTPDKNDFLSVVVNSEDSIKESDYSKNVVFGMENKYIESTRDFVKIKGTQAKLLENNYTYYELAEESGYWNLENRKNRLLLIAISIFTFSLIIGYLTYNNYKRDHLYLNLIYVLGIQHKVLKSNYIHKVTILNGIAFLSGGTLGVFLSTIMVLVLKIVLDYLSIKLLIPFNYLLVVNLFAFCVSEIFVFILVVLIKSRKISLQKRKSINERPDKLNTIFKTAYSRMNRRNMFAQTFVVSIGLIVLGISMYLVQNKKIDYQNSLLLNNFDFLYGSLSIRNSADKHMSNETLNQIKKIYGIDNVNAYKILNYVPISWEGESSSIYANKLKTNFWPYYAGEDSSYSFVINCDDECLKYYGNEIDEGYIDYDEFNKGNSVILYIPDYIIYKNEYLIFQENTVFNNKMKVYHEKTINPGDYITLGNTKVKISGIIREFSRSDLRSIFSKPYVMFIGKNMLNKLSNGVEENSYESLLVNMKDNINFEQSKNELMQIKSDLPLMDYHTINDETWKEWTIYFYCGVMVCVITIILIILYIIIMDELTKKSLKIHIKTYYAIGTSKEKLYYMITRYLLKKSVISFVIALFFVLSFSVTDYVSTTFVGNNPDIYLRIKTSVTATIGRTPWCNLILTFCGICGFRIIKKINTVKIIFKNIENVI